MKATASKLPWDGEPYSVKRHGVTVTNCDSEPVQTPGCVQSHGVLLVLRLADLTVLQVSDNVAAVLGTPVEALLGHPAAALVGPDGEARLREVLDTEPAEHNPLYAFTLPARRGGEPLDVTLHTTHGVAVVELEATGRNGPHPDLYGLIKHSVVRLQAAATLRAFCTMVTEELRRLTGFDRLMVYKFHADHSGEVFAESRRDDLPPWLGLRYPAEDIPKPAREIFMKTWVRPIPDVGGGLAELVPLVDPDTGRPLDMTHCALRGPSVMYTEYLRNMKVTAGLTMPIRREGELWGLIACHHYAGPRMVPHSLRAACELLAQVVSLQHRVAEDREELSYRMQIETVHERLVARASHTGGLVSIMEEEGHPTLLDGLAAGGAALYHHDRWWRVGVAPSEPQLEALAAWLEQTPAFTSASRPLYVDDALAQSFPAAAAFADVASGLLAFAFSPTRRSFMMWFRPETIQTVTWAGNPHDNPKVVGPHGPRLTPRVSFELWKESVRGRSIPWRTVEVDAAARLRTMIMELMVTELVISRAKQLAELNADLARSNEELDAFAYVASHDLKEPLRGIHKYASLLLQDAADLGEEHRRQLERLLRLTLRMDSLLDSLLHFARVGRVSLAIEDTDLNEVLEEAVEMIGSRTANGSSAIVVPRPLPIARCDRVRVREVFVNLLSNALKYNDEAEPRVEIGYVRPDEAHPRSGWPAEARRHTVYFVRDNGIGISPRHFEQVFKMFKRLHGREDYGGGTGAGLTIVKKLVERHRGQVWLHSAVGVGTTVYFTLPYDGG
jgi:chemotaxis family two-component system sensor kinase Cph1